MNEDKVTCRLCNREFEKIDGNHLKTHGIDMPEYLRMFPDVSTITEGLRRRISQSLIGSHEFNEETRKRISEALKHRDKEVFQRISQSLMGHEVSEETRKKISESLALNSEERGRKISEALMNNTNALGHTLGEEAKRIIGEASTKANLGRTHSEEAIERMSEARKRLWKDPEYASSVFRAVNRRPNESELRLLSILDEHYPNEWKYVGGDESSGIGGRYPDFINVNGEKQIIEMFGTYWHDPDLFPDRPTEEELIEHYKDYGFDCLIIWEYDVWNEALVLKELERLK